MIQFDECAYFSDGLAKNHQLEQFWKFVEGEYLTIVMYISDEKPPTRKKFKTFSLFSNYNKLPRKGLDSLSCITEHRGAKLHIFFAARWCQPDLLNSRRRLVEWSIPTVGGRNPAPPVTYETLWKMGYSSYQLVQDFFHQQYGWEVASYLKNRFFWSKFVLIVLKRFFSVARSMFRKNSERLLRK